MALARRHPISAALLLFAFVAGLAIAAYDQSPDVDGTVAHDAADSGNPVKVGLKAVNHGTTPTSVTNNDRTNWYANRAGVPFVIGGHPNVTRLADNISDADGAQTDAILQAVGATERFVVTSVIVTCDNANTVDVRVILEWDDTPDVHLVEHPGIPAGGGFVWGDGSGILAIGGAGQDLLLTSEDPVTGSFAYTVSGYLIAES